MYAMHTAENLSGSLQNATENQQQSLATVTKQSPFSNEQRDATEPTNHYLEKTLYVVMKYLETMK